EQVGHVQAERDVLAASDNAWVVGLEYSFQDEINLYMVSKDAIMGPRYSDLTPPLGRHSRFGDKLLEIRV
ncbi:unnamed protein product, partial [Laminaria digitata]